MVAMTLDVKMSSLCSIDRMVIVMSSCRMGEEGVRDARVTVEFEVRRVEELADVLRWIFAPSLAFQVFPRFQTIEMDRFTAY